MHVRGMGQTDYSGEEWWTVSDAPISQPPPVWNPAQANPVYIPPAALPGTFRMPSTTGPTQSQDWTGVFKVALDSWGKVATTNAQIELQKAQMQNRPLYYGSQGMPLLPSALPGAPGYLPFPGAAAGGTLLGLPTGVVIVGVAAVAAILILRR